MVLAPSGPWPTLKTEEMTMTANNFWTESQVETLKISWAEKMSTAEIADLTGRSEKSVFHKAAVLGLRSRKPVDSWKDYPERDEIVKTMWAENASASEIAQVLGNGITRSAVLGRIKRLDLPKREGKKKSPSRGAKALRPSTSAITGYVAVKPVRSREPYSTPIDPNAPTPLKLTLEQREKHQCAWIVNDGGPYLYCGHQAGETAYCPYHEDLMRSAPKPMRRAA